MQQPVPNERSRPRRCGAILKRWLAKTLLFAAATFLVLNPNLERTLLQVGHAWHPEALIQTNFTALPMINAQIDRWVNGNHERHSEAQLVSAWVVKKISYVSDYENWGNVEYWPTAEEAWHKRQEDCDGRAILTASILRSRGYDSARLVVGVDHMWIRVDQNEKDPSKPPDYIALLSPNDDFSLELQDSPLASDLLLLAKAFLHPTAFRETGTHLFADLPVLRKVVWVLTFLLFCYHPCRYRTGLLAISALGLVAVKLLADWQPGHGQLFEGATGGLLFMVAVILALGMERFRSCCRTSLNRWLLIKANSDYRLHEDRTE